MAIIRHILIGIAALGICTNALHAQLPSRSEIDQAVNPSLSTIAQRAVRAEKSVMDLGIIAQEKQCRVSFTLKNSSATTVAITELRSTCSCLKVATKPKTLRPNEELEVVATFNSAQRSGKVKLDIFVYTSLDAKSPTERLTVTGTMAQSDKFSYLPYSAGELKLSRNTVTIDNTKVGATRTERIAVANAGVKELRITAQSTIDELSLRLEPTTLKPGEEGDIVISYTPKRAIQQDIQTILILEGCTGRPTERTIKITIKR